KNKIELDKQASFLVWKLREAKSGPEAIEEQLSKINDADEKVFFQRAVEKYKRVMGVA
ncbi:TPA: DUF3283 family protein, partial [Vibrio parahaemolyticus]|nr:DUF3283 family protein [Vibrio parahaemolyticus]